MSRVRGRTFPDGSPSYWQMECRHALSGLGSAPRRETHGSARRHIKPPLTSHASANAEMAGDSQPMKAIRPGRPSAAKESIGQTRLTSTPMTSTPSSCPQCGGRDLSPITPNYWECRSEVIWDRPLPVGPGGSVVPVLRSSVCGHRFHTGVAAAGDPAKCKCGAFAIGACADCGCDVCGDDSTRFDGRLLCTSCRATAYASSPRGIEQTAAEDNERNEKARRSGLESSLESLSAPALNEALRRDGEWISPSLVEPHWQKLLATWGAENCEILGVQAHRRLVGGIVWFIVNRVPAWSASVPSRGQRTPSTYYLTRTGQIWAGTTYQGPMVPKRGGASETAFFACSSPGTTPNPSISKTTSSNPRSSATITQLSFDRPKVGIVDYVSRGELAIALCKGDR